MDSRDFIIDRIRKAQTPGVELPLIPTFEEYASVDLISEFEKRLQANHASVFRCRDNAMRDQIVHNEIKDYARVISAVDGTGQAHPLSSTIDPHELNDVDCCVLVGGTAVAENGAILIREESMPHRVLPFIVQHLIVIVKATDIVPNMHVAYQKADKENGFSVFIAGPSKTADIEQSLVIGAHGPKKMTVVVMTD